MKIFVKTLKGSHFEIEVKPDDRVEDVKKVIESNQGENVYPASQQMIIHQGKVLKEGTTLEENSVAEKSFVVVMLSKNKASPAEGSAKSSAPTVKEPQTSAPATSTSVSNTPQPPSAVAVPVPTSAPILAANEVSLDVYDQAASDLVAASNLQGTIQQLLDMGGGRWDRDTVVRALRAAFNNPARAAEYLFSGIPESAEAPSTTGSVPSGQAVNVPSETQAAQPATVPAAGPNANPLDLFPQGFPSMGSNAAAGGANTLDFLRNSPQFQALRAMVQANPQILQPMLQELGKQNPQLVRLIQEHQSDFLHLINEPTAEGGEGVDNILGQLAGAMPQAVTVTPEEHEAIERLGAMGFDRDLVLEVFFACNKNEELAANYLLDHMHELDE